MRIFVIGSAKEEIASRYLEESEKVIKYMVESDYQVLCCAEEKGIVGKVYQLTKGTNKAILTVPKVYLPYTNHIKEKIDIVTETINQRTDESIQKSDIILCFPGGFGTLYEMTSAIHTKVAKEHSKPILIINYFGFFDDFLKQIEKSVQEQFATKEERKTFEVVTSSEEAISMLEKWRKEK